MSSSNEFEVMLSQLRKLLSYGTLLLSLLLFAFSVTQLGRIRPAGIVTEMQVALPRFIQVIAAMGDRYLAADIATFRAVVASTSNMDEGNFRVQGQIQRDAAWLNPSHEDNYYVAAAILPWHGQFDAAQEILAKAKMARPYDWQPAFFYAFNLYYIKKDPIAGANALFQAAPGLSERDRSTMEAMAYAWSEKGYDPANAIAMLEFSAQTARTGALKRYLLARAERLRGLLKLEEAATAFSKRYGRLVGSLDELVSSGFIERIPDDPLGLGYSVNEQGKPILGKQRGKK